MNAIFLFWFIAGTAIAIGTDIAILAALVSWLGSGR
jgi:hypothetical protein